LTFTGNRITKVGVNFFRKISANKAGLIFLSICYGLILLLVVLQFLVRLTPWLGDTQAPQVEISGLNHSLSFNAAVTFQVTAYDKQSAVGRIGVFLDGKQIDSWHGHSHNVAKEFRFDSSGLHEGRYVLHIEVADTSLFTHTNYTRYEILIDRTPPSLFMSDGNPVVRQGNTLALFVQAGERLKELSGKLFDKTLRFFPRGSNHKSYRCLLGIPVLQVAKQFPLHLTAVDLAGNRSELDISVDVEKTGFHKEAITLTPGKAGLFTDVKSIREDARKINAVFTTYSADQLWQQSFVQPTTGHISSHFGEQRVFNRRVYSVHGGVDIANRAGTPIYAANTGTVALAEKLHLFGNAVIIDHGQGLHTMYAHMRKLMVTAGRKIVKGQLIGYMGDTGLTTGPHLHWEMRIGRVAVNPFQWTKRSFDFP